MQNTERAVERLTEAHTEHTEAGMVEWPPLLVWLEQSITTIMGRSGGGSGDGLPLNTEALALQSFIDNRLAMLLKSLGHTRSGARSQDVAFAWEIAKSHRAQSMLDDHQWETVCDEFVDWVHRIEAEDDRARTMELTVPCPRCGVRWVDGPTSRVAAVSVEFKEGQAPVAECRNSECAAIWAGWAQMAVLGVSVDATMNLEVLNACGIDLGVILAPGDVM